MNVLVINCGSSSLKYQVIDSVTEKVEAKGLCERIGIDGVFSYQPAGGAKEESEKPMPTHNEAVSYVIEAFNTIFIHNLIFLHKISQSLLIHRVVFFSDRERKMTHHFKCMI